MAMAQTRMVVDSLIQSSCALRFDIVPIHTTGDRDQHSSLAAIGGQGVFVKEIEHALFAGEIDLAVHSLKDVPAMLPEGLVLAAILPRADPRDALVSPAGLRLDELPGGARVGTGSRRRKGQLLARRPDLDIVDLRGNVDTRLKKVARGDYDAIVLAIAGLSRLGRQSAITEILAPEVMLPAAGQGAVCVQARSRDESLLAAISIADDPEARATVLAERGFLRELGGGCRLPIAAYAILDGETLWLRGMIMDDVTGGAIRGEARGSVQDAESLGGGLATELLALGAHQLLERYHAT